MTIREIEVYLDSTEYHEIDSVIFDTIKDLKSKAVEDGDEEKANYLWCLEQVAKVKREYLNAINHVRSNEQLQAWTAFDRCDIEASFVRKHMEFENDKFQFEFILKQVLKFQKLFPYRVFMSRESIESDFSCSICGSKMSLRSGCGHIVGELYNGEMCCRVIGHIEFLAMAMVSNPVDKYTVPQIEGHEYDYRLINYIVSYLNSPYQNWDYEIQMRTWRKRDEPDYRDLGRNNPCSCGSGKKFKKCCLSKEGMEYEHYKFSVEPE